MRIIKQKLAAALVGCVTAMTALSTPAQAAEWTLLNMDGYQLPVQPNIISTSNLRLSNPDDYNENPDWDWTIDEPVLLYPTSLNGQVLSVNLPYFDNQGTAKELNTGIDGTRDIQKADGWVLIYRDFGFKDPDLTSARTVALPLFVLYNRYRGILRTFYFNTHFSETYTHAVATVTQRAGYESALFTYGKEDYYLDSFDRTAGEKSIHQIAINAWSYFDIPLIGYQPDPVQGSKLNFQIEGVILTDTTEQGDIQLSQVIEELGQVNGLDMDDLGKAVKNGSTMFNKGSKGLSQLQKLYGKGAGKWWFSNDINSLLNSSFAQAIPYASAAIGVVKALIGIGKDERPMPMKFEGELTLNGQHQTSTKAYEFFIRMPGAPDTSVDVSGRSLYTKPLGIYNIGTQPEHILAPDGEKICGVVGNTTICTPYIYIFRHLDMRINPDLLADADVKVETMLITEDYVDADTVFGGGTEFGQKGVLNGAWFEPDFGKQLPLRLTIKPKNNSDEVTIMNLHRVKGRDWH